MTRLTAPVRNAVRTARRVRGASVVRSLTTTGVATNAAVTALDIALQRPRGLPHEQVWLRRIEAHRRELSRSQELIEHLDFGAGAGHQFDVGDFETTNASHKTVGEMSRSSKPRPWAYLLFRLVRELKPDSALEFGSCVGISAAYQSSALELNGAGTMVTLEGSPALAGETQRTLRSLGLDHRCSVVEGRFSESLPHVLAESGPFGFAFIDGHHIESATLEYMEAVLRHAASEAILVFDDINWSEGMRAAWRAISTDPRFALTVDLRSVGLAIVSESAATRQQIRIPYY